MEDFSEAQWAELLRAVSYVFKVTFVALLRPCVRGHMYVTCQLCSPVIGHFAVVSPLTQHFTLS